MKKLLLFTFFIGFIFNISAQSKLSITLQKDIQEHPKQMQEILVVGVERVDAAQFELLHRNEYDTQAEFTVAFLKELKKQSEFKDYWMDELMEYKFEYEVIHQFWSVNIVAIKAPAKTIQYLKAHPDVYWMEEIKERPIEWVKPVSMVPSSTKSSNGKELGISAVKGDSLWLLGYTGKGSRLLTFDTGIWPNHPVFRDQFLGNHVPLDHAWFGYDTYFPGDKSNSHGTHVTGTCLGLDPANSDTIGLAFNAYFMATDPIVQSLADIKTAFEIMKGYEWALNPDGDINTTNDMPHVINNSWGRPFGADDSVACDGWVNDLFVNVEIAGIISIHSAGNSGPGSGTIGYPAVSNASVVNNFSIGAVNGNISSFPIAGFSSRGPTVCGDTGSLLIKPEVVAPGVNVRSSIRVNTGDYSYANFQGTSMAAPHVSGVSLLLREAFPNASATEIKESLFYTAKDLGVTGEDNTYGKGMIDALAAYNYLSGIYTPFVPAIDTFDIHCTGFNFERYESVCDFDKFIVYMDNTHEMDSRERISFTIGLTDGWKATTTVSGGSFQKVDSFEMEIPYFHTVTTGWNTFYVYIKKSNQTNNPLPDEVDTLNNIQYFTIWVNGEESLPYSENFDTSHVFESSMYVGNPDQITTWDTMTVQGKTSVTNAATMQFPRYSPRKYQHDYLQTPNFILNSPTKLTLTFDLSYQVKYNGFKDSLMVIVSTDCGETWDNPIYAKGPDSLSTTNKPLNGNWIPQDVTDWRTEVVDLSMYKNNANIMVRLETANGQGNNLYIDNINIFDETGPSGIDNKLGDDFVMYPNPVTNGTLYFNAPISGSIHTISGVHLITFAQQNEVNVSKLTKGVYLVTNAQTNQVYKLVVQ